MQPQYNQYNLEASFILFLRAENVSTATCKNYASDLRHFLGWMRSAGGEDVSSDERLVTAITDASLANYKAYLTSSNLPLKTVNRRLSALRKFCSFCISQGWMSSNPAKKVQNVVLELNTKAVATSPLLDEYKKYLAGKGYHNNEIDEKITDVEKLLVN
jgi:site-specific recombinase XerD